MTSAAVGALSALLVGFVVWGWMGVLVVLGVFFGLAALVFYLLHPRPEDLQTVKTETANRARQRQASLQGWEADAQQPAPMKTKVRVMPNPHPAAMMAMDAQALADLERCRHRGDWEAIRITLQKVAYGMTQAPEDEKRRFTDFAAGYAADDPLCLQVWGVVLPAIAKQPGMKQTETYGLLPHIDPEWVRYALYYAAELGRIQRVKKGNSYTLWEPGAAPKPTDTAAEHRARRKEHWQQRMPQLLESARSGDRPIWQFRAVGDSNDPPACAAVSGTLAHFESPFWQKHNPAKCRRQMCRCSIRSYTEDEAREMGWRA